MGERKIRENDPARPTNLNNGLTIRQHFAAMAMQGLLANPSMSEGVSELIASGTYNMPEKGKDVIAEMAVQSADALIKVLNK